MKTVTHLMDAEIKVLGSHLAQDPNWQTRDDFGAKLQELQMQLRSLDASMNDLQVVLRTINPPEQTKQKSAEKPLREVNAMLDTTVELMNWLHEQARKELARRV